MHKNVNNAKILVLNLTNKCNLNCKTCLRDYSSNNENSHNYLDIKTIKKIIPTLKKYNFIKIGLTGGEPCFHPELDKIIDLLYNNGFKLGLFTNGYNLSKYESIIASDKINTFVISIDGATEKNHDYIRSKGSFRKAIQFIEYLKQNKVKANIKTQICLNKINMSEIENVYKLAKKLEINFISFLNTIKTDKNKDICLSSLERQKSIKRINKINSLSPKIQVAESLKTSTNKNYCKKLNSIQLSINPRNEVVFCCDTIGNGAVIESLKNKSFEKIYEKAIKWKDYLIKTRHEHLKKNRKKLLNISNCDFCNYCLRERIK